MGAGPFSSDSQTRSDASVANVGASDQAIAIFQRGRRGTITLPGGVTIAAGKGATVSLTTTDGGLVATASSLLRDVVNNQSNEALQSGQFQRDLAETKLTGGDNLQQKTILIGLALLAGLVAVVFYFRR